MNSKPLGVPVRFRGDGHSIHTGTSSKEQEQRQSEQERRQHRQGIPAKFGSWKTHVGQRKLAPGACGGEGSREPEDGSSPWAGPGASGAGLTYEAGTRETGHEPWLETEAWGLRFTLEKSSPWTSGSADVSICQNVSIIHHSARL